jgi:hypothetical protein
MPSGPASSSNWAHNHGYEPAGPPRGWVPPGANQGSR